MNGVVGAIVGLVLFAVLIRWLGRPAERTSPPPGTAAVWLEELGEDRVQVIHAARTNNPGLELDDFSGVAVSTPLLVVDRISLVWAESVAEAMRAHGATVRVSAETTPESDTRER